MNKRYMYNLTHQVASLGDIGRLTPTCILPIAPGDTVSGKVGLLIRMSPLKHALVQDLFVDQFLFYVPLRLLWADWENFIAAGPMDTPTYTPPTVNVVTTQTNWECLFMPSHPTQNKTYSAWSTYAYNLIWNEFFRDEDQAVRLPTDLPLQYGIAVNFKKDYWSNLNNLLGKAQAVHSAIVTAGAPDTVAATEILRAIAQQKIAMKRATYGTRYVDILRSYGINVNYQMLQRPEVVGIARGTMNITDVVQTAPTDLGDLAGHGISGTRLSLRRKTFPEHGLLFGACVVRPVMAHSRLGDWFDSPRSYTSFYDPGLVPLPPVNVLKKDVEPSIATAFQNESIGFQPWGNWYRRAMSRTHLRIQDWTGGMNLDPTATIVPDTIKIISPPFYDTMFNDVTYRHFQISAVNSLRALRFIPRQNISTVTGIGG